MNKQSNFISNKFRLFAVEYPLYDSQRESCGHSVSLHDRQHKTIKLSIT